MSKKKEIKHDPAWAKAKKLCRLNAEDIRMAKELGFKPRSLTKNIPSKDQQWKTPVKYWIRDLYAKKQAKAAKKAKRKAQAAGQSSPPPAAPSSPPPSPPPPSPSPPPLPSPPQPPPPPPPTTDEDIPF